jgi:hypothetical protein
VGVRVFDANELEAIAIRELTKLRSDLVITGREDRGYRILYWFQTRQFVETGGFGHKVVGNAPFVVLYADGTVHHLIGRGPMDVRLTELERDCGLVAPGRGSE